MTSQKTPLIGVVGPCKSGKTSLKRNLEKAGYSVRQIAQEHSYVQDMWQKIARPDLLIFLDVSYPKTLVRSSLGWSEAEYDVQIERLTHARANADLIIETDPLTSEEVAQQVLAFLRED